MEFWKLFKKGIRKKFGIIIDIFSLLFKALIILLILGVVANVLHYYTNEKLVKEINVSYTYNNGYINDNEESKLTKQIESFIDNQDEIIKKKFFEQNWQIIIDKEIPMALESNVGPLMKENKDKEFYTINGLTVPKAKTIYINSENIEEETYRTFVHEFGHFVDYEFGYVSISPDFIELYERDRLSYSFDDFFDEYQADSSTEFFASAFMYYYCDGEELKNAFPDAYNYIDELLKNTGGIDGFKNTVLTGAKGTYLLTKKSLKEFTIEAITLKNEYY